jgi:hypothetical protein
MFMSVLDVAISLSVMINLCQLSWVIVLRDTITHSVCFCEEVLDEINV